MNTYTTNFGILLLFLLTLCSCSYPPKYITNSTFVVYGVSQTSDGMCFYKIYTNRPDFDPPMRYFGYIDTCNKFIIGDTIIFTTSKK